MDISIIIPAHNEEKNIAPLYKDISRVMKSVNENYEVIFIDDGSTDGTFKEINALNRSEKKCKYLQMRKKFGKSAALAVGFAEASGEIVITMDADMQDDPEEIPKFIKKIQDGWDLVTGWKKIRKDPMERRLASKLFNLVVSGISGLKLHDFNCGFKACKRDVLKTIRIYGELHRFIPMIAHSYGFKVTETPVKHHKRRFGKTKYGKGRYLAGLLDCFTTVFLTQYIRRPLHLLGKISLVSFTMGMVLLFYVGVMKFIFAETGDRPSLVIAVFLMGTSIQILLFGLLAELLTHVNQQRDFRTEDFITKKML